MHFSCHKLMFETENWRERAVRRSTETNEESSSVNAGYGRNWRVGAIDVLRRNDSGASRVSLFETGSNRARLELGRRTVSPHRPWP